MFLGFLIAILVIAVLVNINDIYGGIDL